MAWHVGFSIMLKACVQAGDKTKEMSWRKQFKEKLAFSFCDQSRLDKDLAALRSLNRDFHTIGDQIFKLESRRANPVQRTTNRQDKDIEKLRLIHRASILLYQALGSACTKHTEHQAHFCLQPSLKEDLHPQVRFSIAFNNLTLGNTSGLADLLWFDVDTSIKEALTVDTRADAAQICNVLAQVSSSLKRRNLSPSPSPPPATKSRKRGKRAPFAPSTPPPGRPLLPPVIQLLPLVMEPPNLCKHGNFCNQLRDCSRLPLVRQDRCIGLLEETEKYRHLVYLPQASPVPQQTRTISLATLFRTARKQDLSDGLALHERIGLAKLLSTAVLQFHATSWLGGRWRSEDVLFFYVDPSTRGVEEIKSFNAPYMNVSVKGINGPLSRVPTFPTTRSFVQNPLLFDLGVMLLELAFQAPLRQLQKPVDLENGQEDMHTEFFTAKRLCRSSMQLGLRYKEVARKCIHCDFGIGDDLNKPELQEAFYREIICELDKLESEFRRLQLGA